MEKSQEASPQVRASKEPPVGGAPVRVNGEITLTSKGLARIRSGHLWVYRSDLQAIQRAESGAVVRVVDHRGRFVAWAHYGAESEIALRVLSRQPDERIDRDFWRSRLAQAIDWRESVIGQGETCRLVHAEGDGLPGLVVDRYGDALVLQTLTQGMEALKALWVELLSERLTPRCLVERNDVRVRQLEGLPLQRGLLAGDLPAEGQEISENGLRFLVDLLEGQKTGAFLDQRENRAAAERYAHGRGLDCFTFYGSFALHLARRCQSVTAIDLSTAALERARQNAERNQLANVTFLEANVFDQLRIYDDAGEQFETIVLDPPAFARNRAAVAGALRGYKEINLRAMRLLSPGGVLVTSSCSHHVGEPLFLEMLMEAAADAGRTFQVLERRSQPRDHPALLTVPETNYLKCVILRRLS
ncbi:MAG: class I SAM-dependent rRNA methyltransferase [Blastocatellia bacterium]|jgi:23S rRNA (cytosine1962-C5)-methyltransferase